MAEERTLTQPELKELLGKFYDEDKHYLLNIEAWDNAHADSTPELNFDVQDLDYIVEPGEITTAVKLDVDASHFLNELKTYDKIYNQPIEKIRSLSMYDKLVKEYGFKDQDYIDKNDDTLDEYINDHSDEEHQFRLSVTLKETFNLTAPEMFDNPSYIGIYETSQQLVNSSEIITPNIINELGLSGQLVEEESRILDELFDILGHDNATAYVEVNMKIDS